MKLASLFKDPPPLFAFELSQAGIAMATLAKPAAIEFLPLAPGVLSVSPLKDNVLLPDELAAAVREIAPPSVSKRRRDVAVILPDNCTRVAVLDFDSFPSDPKEQLALVRFRMKKSVPFDVETAAVGYWAQPAAGKKVDVVAVVAPLEIVARYEAPFRLAGLAPGFVTTSAVAMLSLVSQKELTVIAKLTGEALTLMVMQHGTLKLVRCLDLHSPTVEDIAADLYPTLVYVEDQLAAKAELILLAGFGAETEPSRQLFEGELGIRVEALSSPLGQPNANTAGLAGYLSSMMEQAA
ncbi:MAG: hypothetical protein ABIZ80_11205 [Bryobacteraceae bacterium]